ncbi:hypothetical protein FRZ67_19325 [Panacibacter ginsenosidivorans]|uniref:Uncharacterized protein n=1 Tax=Panacibacter ginsenosidivorans TaxID=1813871 RepID=A0A5B8VEA0_9BACT|nr:hypothetical protein [Panacibacter ginsenosidivorans]QEC69353.1 hypothetical protein FRZ67_19325 [Panacibacter ginsenosidivorans]
METVYGTPQEIFIDGEQYMIQSEDHIDQVYYHVVKDGKELAVIGLNENAAWEANNDMDEDLVAKIGEAIEQKSN